MNIDISYGVLHYNPNDDLVARQAFVNAVDSLANNRSDSFKSEVVIIDQGNSHREAEVSQGLAKQYGFNYVSLKENVGISRGINLIANMARGKFISLVTSDVIFTPGLDESLVNTLEMHDDIWQICPASDNSDLIHQRQGYTDGGVVLAVSQELTIQFWKRKAFEVIGFFDERWKACYENMDYGLRLFIAGAYAAVSHEAFCPHDMHMCVRSGARAHSYDDYVGNNGEFDPSPLETMWQQKWPKIRSLVDLYSPFSTQHDKLREVFNNCYRHNLYLSYQQEVNY